MATNTIPTKQTHTAANNSSGNTSGPYAISFDYLSESDVEVRVSNVLKTQTTHYTFPTKSTIQFTSGNFPTSGATIEIKRNTDITIPKVDFEDGSVLTESDLDNNSKHILFGMQETKADVETLVSTFVGSSAPTGISNGARWYDTVSGRTFIYYVDADSAQWVEANPPFGVGDLSNVNLSNLTNAHIASNAAIAQSKLDLSITNTEVNNSAAIAQSKLNLSITNSEVNNSAAIDSSKLSFTQTGTGATARTVDSKFKDFVSAKDFGAVGDGSNDDTAEIQAAINTGKPVYLPKGTYKITDTLTLNAGYRCLIGDEAMPVIEMHTENKPAIAITEPTSGLNEYSRVENLYIQRKVGGSFTCPNYNAILTETLAGVIVSGHGSSTAAAVQSTRISNLRVGNFAVGFYFADCVGVTVHKCFTQNLISYTSATQTANGTTITSSMFGVGFYFDATRFGSGSISPLASIELVECDDGRSGDPTTIQSVSFLVAGSGDIRDIFFQRCESSHADFGWRINGSATTDLNWDVHIIRPIVDAFKTHGMFIENVNGVGAVSIVGGYFVGSTDADAAIKANASNGISITGGTQILGIGNNSSNNTDDGVRFDSCSSCLVVGNRFANLQYAVSLNGTSYSTIQGNVISAAATETETTPTLSEAIRLFNTSTRNTIMGNTIRGKDTSGAAQYTHGINIAASADAKNVLIGNVIDPNTVASEITDNGGNTINANNMIT